MRSKKAVVGIIIFSLLVAIPIFALAAGLVPCGGSGEPACSLCHLFELAQEITDFLTFTIAPILAVLAVAWGGFNIFIAGADPGRVRVGRQAITRTVTGLLIVFGAWVAINEVLIFFSQQTATGTANIFSKPWTDIRCSTKVLETVTAPPPSATASALKGCDSSGKAQDQNGCMRKILNFNGVEVKINYCTLSFKEQEDFTYGKYTGKCPYPCTTVAQLPNDTANQLIALKTELGSSRLLVTGGTESACHSSHGPGKPKVDISKDNHTLNTFICSKLVVLISGYTQPLGYSAGTCLGAQSQTITRNGNFLGYRYKLKGPPICGSILSEGDHWHIDFQSCQGLVDIIGESIIEGGFNPFQ